MTEDQKALSSAHSAETGLVVTEASPKNKLDQPLNKEGIGHEQRMRQLAEVPEDQSNAPISDHVLELSQRLNTVKFESASSRPAHLVGLKTRLAKKSGLVDDTIGKSASRSKKVAKKEKEKDKKDEPVEMVVTVTPCQFLKRPFDGLIPDKPAEPLPANVSATCKACYDVLSKVNFTLVHPEVQLGVIKSEEQFSMVKNVGALLHLDVMRHGKSTRPVCVSKQFFDGDWMILRHGHLYLEGPNVEQYAYEMLNLLQLWAIDEQKKIVTDHTANSDSANTAAAAAAVAPDTSCDKKTKGTATTTTTAADKKQIKTVTGVVDWVGKRVERDGVCHHITIAHIDELKALDVNELLSNNVLVNDWKGIGLGSAQDAKTGNRAFFGVIDWPSANALRNLYGLKPNDFHITIAFQKYDLHGIPKDKSSLL